MWSQYKVFYEVFVNQQQRVPLPEAALEQMVSHTHQTYSGVYGLWGHTIMKNSFPFLNPSFLTMCPHFPMQQVLQQLDRPQWWLQEGEAGVLDEDRIEALAAADPLELRFLGELLGSGFSEEAIVKWSMHPTLGPKLRSGEWLAAESAEGLPSFVREAMAEARSDKPIPGIDFNFSTVSSSKAASRSFDAGRKAPAARPPGVPPRAAGPARTGREFWKRKAAESLRQNQVKGQGDDLKEGS